MSGSQNMTESDPGNQDRIPSGTESKKMQAVPEGIFFWPFSRFSSVFCAVTASVKRLC